jgi:predicted nuclease of predicted toxin-antitoxin system
MKILLDANISWKLCYKLNDVFSSRNHVDNIGIEVPVKDI